ncbi:PLP-dependent aminotransferase family protein [Yinghuangia seranimata]|uniref:MocR-like transcription factor YczR n=1 Tax=Yinghuangia seranimata TaxID=408067 RepID=UPI00248B7B79|nr:PLP-dependent aminotransferase family protein [Yinghuangia seranimata]MDI2129183.1 PLP-dependent aminotransferase family protein [Yinghuangia seranimata]
MSTQHLTVSSARLADLLRPATTATAVLPAAARPGPGGTPAYRALAERIRALVLDGRLPLTARLPAERGLADRLGVSRTTVAAAYDLLRTDGYLISRRGSGSWTALPTHHPEPPTRALVPTTLTGTIDLAVAALPGPGRHLHRAVADAADALPAYTAAHGYHPAGLPLLRETIAERYTRRGAPTTPDQIIVTSGALSAWVLVLRTLLHPGDRVAVESPTYANALEAIRAQGGRTVPVPMGEHGWDLPAWHDALRAAGPRAAYLIPDYQNPTGHLADPDTRRTLIDLARSTGTTLVADETCADLALDVPRLPHPDHPAPMAAHDRSGTVVTIGSAGKSFWGGLRIGWIRGTPDLVRRLVSTRAGLDVAAPVLDQLVLHYLIADHADAILDERLPGIRDARDHLAGLLRTHLPDWTFHTPPGGLSLWAHTDSLSTTVLAEAAGRHGLRVAPGTLFGTTGAFERHLRLPYTLDQATLTEAVRRLAIAAAETGRTRTDAVLAPAFTGCVA